MFPFFFALHLRLVLQFSCYSKEQYVISKTIFSALNQSYLPSAVRKFLIIKLKLKSVLLTILEPLITHSLFFILMGQSNEIFGFQLFSFLNRPHLRGKIFSILIINPPSYSNVLTPYTIHGVSI